MGKETGIVVVSSKIPLDRILPRVPMNGLNLRQRSPAEKDLDLVQRQRPPLLLALFFAIVSIGSIATADLASRVATATRNAKLSSTQVAISVRDIKTGSELIEINDSGPMIPASNMKLFTSGAALDRLGATHALETKLIVQGDTLWFVGAGDPAFGDPEILAKTAWTDTNGNARTGMDVDELLDLMARSVAQSGHQHISELIIDDRVFDRAFAHPEWPQDQYDKRYCAEVAGINLHLNVLSIYVQPAPNQRADIVRIEPDLSWLLPRNDAKAPANARVTKLGATRPRHSNDIRVYGSIAAPFTIDITLTDMPSLVGRLFRDRLQANGVSVDSMRLVNTNDAPRRPQTPRSFHRASKRSFQRYLRVATRTARISTPSHCSS